jgi:hypothetical protein
MAYIQVQIAIPICVEEGTVGLFRDLSLFEQGRIGGKKASLLILDEESTGTPTGSADIEVFQCIAIHITHSHPGTFTGNHLENKRFSSKIAKIILHMGIRKAHRWSKLKKGRFGSFLQKRRTGLCFLLMEFKKLVGFQGIQHGAIPIRPGDKKGIYRGDIPQSKMEAVIYGGLKATHGNLFLIA